jgi:hypothetical protein
VGKRDLQRELLLLRPSLLYTISSLAVLQNGLDIYRERCRGSPLYITQCGFYRLPIHPSASERESGGVRGFEEEEKNQSSITQRVKREAVVTTRSDKA